VYFGTPHRLNIQERFTASLSAILFLHRSLQRQMSVAGVELRKRAQRTAYLQKVSVGITEIKGFDDLMFDLK